MTSPLLYMVKKGEYRVEALRYGQEEVIKDLGESSFSGAETHIHYIWVKGRKAYVGEVARSIFHDGEDKSICVL